MFSIKVKLTNYDIFTLTHEQKISDYKSISCTLTVCKINGVSLFIFVYNCYLFKWPFCHLHYCRLILLIMVLVMSFHIYSISQLQVYIQCCTLLLSFGYSLHINKQQCFCIHVMFLPGLISAHQSFSMFFG